MGDKWLQIIIPLILSGMGIIIFNLHTDIQEISGKQREAKEFIYRIEQTELRVRKIEDSLDAQEFLEKELLEKELLEANTLRRESYNE